MGVGRNIAKLRQDNNLTQKELAEKVGVSVSYLSRIEEGKSPGIKTVAMIANALGVRAEDLYEKS